MSKSVRITRAALAVLFLVVSVVCFVQMAAVPFPGPQDVAAGNAANGKQFTWLIGAIMALGVSYSYLRLAMRKPRQRNRFHQPGLVWPPRRPYDRESEVRVARFSEQFDAQVPSILGPKEFQRR